MAKNIAVETAVPQATAPYGRRETDRVPRHLLELNRNLLRIIGARAAIIFLGLNLADPLGVLPERLGPFPFLPLINILNVALTLVYLGWWWSGRGLRLQLYTQIGIDMLLASFLVALTQGVESVFISFYLFIIIYSGLMLGRNGGMVASSVSAILYSGIVGATDAGVLRLGDAQVSLEGHAFRIAIHAVGFVAVAFLGSYLSQRLHAVEEQLEEKIQSLNQLQRLNEHIVSSIRSGLITTDLAGKIAVFNSSAAELTGGDSTRALGQPVEQVIGEGLWARIRGANLFQDARPLRHEDWITLPGGSVRCLGFSVSPLVDRGNQLLGHIISFQDLTEIKRLEEEVRLKDRMAAIGRMAAGLAHEIRNPLMSMRGSVEILRSHLNLNRTDERLLDILIRESDRLNKFIENFLHLARPGKHAHESVDLVALLRDSVTLLRNSPEVREKHTLLLDFEDPEIPILGNPDQLQQVFWNLAQNALRAMSDEGTLAIHARKADDDGAEVVIEDNGSGMSPEEQEQLFQPFKSSFNGGTGLGLSIVFQIMEDHHGRVLFESEKGRGTKVTLRLPPESGLSPAIAAQ